MGDRTNATPTDMGSARDDRNHTTVMCVTAVITIANATMVAFALAAMTARAVILATAAAITSMAMTTCRHAAHYPMIDDVASTRTIPVTEMATDV